MLRGESAPDFYQVIHGHVTALILKIEDFACPGTNRLFIGLGIPENGLKLQPLTHETSLELVDLVAIGLLDPFDGCPLLFSKAPGNK